MLPYWMLFAVYSLGSFARTSRTEFSIMRSPGFVAGALVCILVVGLRYRVGGDWLPYMFIYDLAGQRTWEQAFVEGDPGYFLLNKIAQTLGYEIWFVNLICALLFTWGVARLAERQPNPWLFFAVATPYLIIVVAMGYTRQAVAIGLLMGGMAAFARREFVRFVIYVIIAATFHKTSVVVLPLIALSATRHRFVIYAVAGALGLMLFMFFLDAFLDRMFRNYFESEMESEGAAIRIVMSMLPASIFLMFRKRFARDPQQDAMWTNFALAAIGITVLLFALPSSTVVDRAALYLIPMQLFVWSYLPYAFPVKGQANRLLIVLVLLYSALVQFAWLNFADHAEYWLPYRFFPLE